MSKADKKALSKKEEEEWEDVEEEEEEAGEWEEEEEDTTIANSDVVMRYKKAAQWANEALQHVVGLCKPGASVLQLCKAGDEMIATKVQTLFKGVDKGIAFPTCVSIGACVCHNSPSSAEEDQKIALNDVVRVDLGVHVDGYSALAAHTVQVTENGQLNAESKEANVIAAGYATLDAALRQLRPGKSTFDVTAMIEKCAAHFGLAPVEGVLSHELKRYIVDGFKTIPGKQTPEYKVHEYELEANSVWTLDVVLTTSKGMKLKERDQKAGVFKAALEQAYNPKLAAAIQLNKEVEQKFQYFPFAVRNLETPKARLGLSEMLKHNNVATYPVLFEKDGETVVQFKVTVLVTEKKIERVTGLKPQAGMPAPKPYADEELAALAKLPLSLVDKKKK